MLLGAPQNVFLLVYGTFILLVMYISLKINLCEGFLCFLFYENLNMLLFEAYQIHMKIFRIYI